MESLFLKTAPPLDLEWLRYEKEAGLNKPKPTVSMLDRQPAYAAECRNLTARMMAPGANNYYLSQGVVKTEFTVPSFSSTWSVPQQQQDGRADAAFPIPVMLYELEQAAPAPHSQEKVVVVYIHGGGLCVGEADSEELSCRRILKDSGIPGLNRVYSVGYRLMPTYRASTSLSDCLDVFHYLFQLIARTAEGNAVKLVLVGSSSGGELAALVSQMAPQGSVDGVVLRGPVTSDAFSGMEYVPERLRPLHTSAGEPSFWNCLLGPMKRDEPRDGLERMPLEAPEEVLKGMPRTWIQVCTNDALYSDGVCYAKALEDAGVQVKVDVVRGWPHTFWLKAPHLPRALEADRAMLEGLAWVAE